jgi:nucleotide-binding universal stress UspA family protein
MTHILIATDGSSAAEAAVAEGVELARLLGARVTLVAVRPHLEDAHAALERALALAEEAGVDAEYEVAEGDAAAEILRAARYCEADLIVVGSRGRGAVAGTLLGRVSRSVLERSTVPVVVVNRRDTARARRRARELAHTPA